MIPYVEFNYEWRQKQSEPKHVSAQLNQTAAPFKYLSFLQWANRSQIWLPACYVYPERYFWAENDYLRLLGTNLSYRLGITARDGEDVRYPQKLTEEDERTVSALYGIDPRFGRPGEMLSAIYNYLAYTETTPYYKALMEFKWRTGLLSFPLFDVRERIKNIDGKLVGYVWDRKQNEYSWRLLTSEVVEEEVEVTRNPTQQTGVYGKTYFPTAGINNESTKLGAYIEELLVWKSEEIGGKNRRLGFSGKYLNEARLTELLDSSEKPIPEEEQVVDFDQYIASFSDLIKIQEQNP